jgi:hypothetical protein
MSDAAPQQDPGAGGAGLTVEVVPEETHRDDMARATRAILAHGELRQHFSSSDLWLVGFDVIDKDDEDGPRFSSTVHDTTTGRAARVDGWFDDLESPVITPMPDQLPPGEDEHAWAVSTLAHDRELGPLLEQEGTVTYRPMPPLANVERPDGTVDRVITVGVRTAGAEPAHRIVGVRTSDGEVVREPIGVPAPSAADCGAPPGPVCPPAAGENQARVRVRRGETVLWELVVVRPQASSGTNGSGVELRTVDYQGQRVLFRAHVPILNVRYEDGGTARGCGPTYRDWQREEACFVADGSEPVAGFRVCASAPLTILDGGPDGGDFRGVALWLDGEELVVVSQLQAGWYRYVSEWRLHADGTIRPRFGFAAAQNPCTCQVHHHHAYWRFDFDVLGPGSNLVQEYNDPPVLGTGNWHTVRYEVRRERSHEHGRYWRVRNTRASQGYVIRPGPHDGTADDYGAGDLWILRYHPDEIDDGQGFTTDASRSRAHLDRFVSGESVERQDVVVWYGAHFVHDPSLGDEEHGALDAGHRVGPDLVPSQWKERPAPTGPFAPLEPPSQEELRPPAAPRP